MGGTIILPLVISLGTFPTPLTLYLGTSDSFAYAAYDPKLLPMFSSYNLDCPYVSSGASPVKVDDNNFRIDFTLPLSDFSKVGTHTCRIDLCNTAWDCTSKNL